MPIVASSLAEYELKRQRMIDDLDKQATVRKMIIKSKKHLKDTDPLYTNLKKFKVQLSRCLIQTK